jgi:Group II intron, maturase-specific domain
MAHTIKDLVPVLRGWINYFRLAQVNGTFEDLDGWLRRKLRCILWRQWKRPRTRAIKLRQRGLDEVRARQSASNGRGPWWGAQSEWRSIMMRKIMNGLATVVFLAGAPTLAASAIHGGGGGDGGGGAYFDLAR